MLEGLELEKDGFPKGKAVRIRLGSEGKEVASFVDGFSGMGFAGFRRGELLSMFSLPNFDLSKREIESRGCKWTSGGRIRMDPATVS